MREKLGLTLRDVELCGARLAKHYRNDEYIIPVSRLSDVENKGVVPSIYRLYTLAATYRCNFLDLLAMYGIDLQGLTHDNVTAAPAKTHSVDDLSHSANLQLPVRMDPSFNLSRTSNLGRLIEQWGVLPVAHLKALADDKYTYGYIGVEDFTMYPLLMPGSFIQVDESKDQVQEGAWRSEYERPIYFVETREEHICCWCSVKGDVITLQPHPLSPVPVRMMKYPREAEVVGQVVGFAMRLDQFSRPAPLPESKGPAKLN
jgi:hypothetical protein